MRVWLLSSTLAVACARPGDEVPILQPQDLLPVEVPFDENAVLDAGSLTDALALPTAKEVQGFLDKTPYGRKSFLSTYASNGVRAADAIARAADKYQINPIVLLVRAQIDQGLIGLQQYPVPPPRVEYAFQCGCPGGTTKCDPAYAGFDKQVDCLAQHLRSLVDEVLTSGASASGWGQGKPQRTSDGFTITPSDPGTAVLYAYAPYLAKERAGGVWVFWNVWQSFIAHIGYAGALGGPAKRWIGDTCASDGLCAAIPGGVCVQNFPSGMCTTACTKTEPCPNDMEHPESFCANFGAQGGFCLLTCNPSNPASCRAGYACKLANELGTPANRPACLPK